MKSWDVSHLPDHVLLRELNSLVGQERITTAALLAHLGEVDARRLYAADAYPSMYLYCLQVLHFSEDVAVKRITAARAARRFPAILSALADGRLHLSGVVMLEPNLSPDTADALLAAAEHKTKFEIAQLIAERFPRKDVATSITPLAPAAPPVGTASAPACTSEIQPAPGRVVTDVHKVGPGLEASPASPPSPGQAIAPAPGKAIAPAPPTSAVPPSVVHTTVTPLSPGRYLLKGTISQEALDALNEAKALLAHERSPGDLMRVLERVLEDWVSTVKRRREAATDSPRARRSAGNGRYVPAEVERAVRKRDGDRCTYKSDTGRRCTATTNLELDHVVPVARGGRTTLENLRLLCTTHNQLEAERAFGRQFMREKRGAARAIQTARGGHAARASHDQRAAQVTQVTHAAQAPPPPAP